MIETVIETDRECSQCEDGVYYKYDDDLICGTCHYAPETKSQKSGLGDTDQWEDWWDERSSEKYDGWHGADRIKFVGGFVKPYTYDDV